VAVPPSARVGIDVAAQARREHVLVVRSVEDHDLARPRHLRVDAPQVIVCQFEVSRTFERRHAHALRVDAFEDRSDGAVLAARVAALQNDEQLVPAVGVEQRLELVEPGDERRHRRLPLALADPGGFRGIMLVKVYFGVAGEAVAAEVDGVVVFCHLPCVILLPVAVPLRSLRGL
jgi:hypothetical protein